MLYKVGGPVATVTDDPVTDGPYVYIKIKKQQFYTIHGFISVLLYFKVVSQSFSVVRRRLPFSRGGFFYTRNVIFVSCRM